MVAECGEPLALVAGQSAEQLTARTRRSVRTIPLGSRAHVRFVALQGGEYFSLRFSFGSRSGL